MALIAVLEGLEAYGLRPLTTITNWTVDSVRDLCEKVKGEFLASEQMTARARFMTGRKPISRKEMKEMRKNELLAKALRKAEEPGP